MLSISCKIKNIFMLLPWLLISLLLSQGLFVGLVMCLEVNGHIRLEIAHENCPYTPLSLDHPSPCLDLPFTTLQVGLDSNPLISALKPPLQVKASQYAACFVHPTIPADSTPADVFPHLRRAGDTSISGLHTVVLLI
jgi:hypothetical protein